MATRRKIVSADIAADGADVTLNFHGPADANGKFPVVDSAVFDFTSIPADRAQWFALYGVTQVVATRYNRLDEDATPGDVRDAVFEVLDAIRDGTWTPGRVFTAREPSDLELAISEATGQPVREVMERIENEVVRDENGQPKLDARGRQRRVFNQSMLDALANDAKIKPILARLTAERAKRLSAEAKAGGGTNLLGSMFSGTSAPVDQAEAAQ